MFNMGWKTIVGGILGVGSWVFGQEAFSVEVIIQAIGMILTVVGVRHAIAKKP